MGCRLVGTWKGSVLISFVLPLLFLSCWGCSEAPVVKVGDTAQDFTLFLIGKDGLIKGKAYGYMNKEALWKFVTPYLKGSPRSKN